jgi:hypothetical protein
MPPKKQAQPQLVEPLITLVHAMEYCSVEAARHSQQILGWGWYHNGRMTLRTHIANEFLRQRGQ